MTTGEVIALIKAFGGGGSSGGGVLVVHDVNGTLDKTWQEIYDAFPNVCVDMYADGSKSSLINIYGSADSGEYGLNVDDTGTCVSYSTEAADGCPVLQEG